LDSTDTSVDPLHPARIAPWVRRHEENMTDTAVGLSAGSEVLLGAGIFEVTALVGAEAVGVAVAVVSPGSSTPTFGAATTWTVVGELTEDGCGAPTVVVRLTAAAVVRGAVADLAYSVNTAVRSAVSVAVVLGTVAALLAASAA
jgi:hypothetical protein